MIHPISHILSVVSLTHRQRLYSPRPTTNPSSDRPTMETTHLLLAAVSFLSSLLLLLLLLLAGAKRRRPRNLPPGPRPLPIIGSLHLLGRLPHLSLHKLAKRYGPILHLTLGEVPTVVISSSRLAREALRTHDLPLCSRPRLYSAEKLFYGSTDMGFSPYGPYWRHIRKICILELLSPRRVESFAFVREQEAARLADRIAAASHTVNISKELGFYANAVLCRAAFGRDFTRGGEYERHGFHEMLMEYQVLLGGFSIGDFFPSCEWIHGLTGVKARLERTFRRFDRFFDEIIQERLERRRSDSGSQPEHKDLLDVLLDLKDTSGLDMPLTLDNIKAVILDMFAAGTDTTFIALDWGMTELVMNPEAMKRAQDEVRSVVGERRYVLESDIEGMHYLKAVIKEIFRLHPPVPLLLPRESMEPVTIDGYEIPARTRVFVNAWAIGRDPELWESPDAFEPERFIGSFIDFKGLDYELIPFGAGRRSCPAIVFGTSTIEVALAQLLRSFDWELLPGTGPEDLDLTEVFGITMPKVAELVLVAKPVEV